MPVDGVVSDDEHLRQSALGLPERRKHRRSLFRAGRQSYLGALPLGARQAASTQKDRRGFARRGAKTALLFRFLRSRLTLAHPTLGEAKGCIANATQ
jgi:hypothetical protein